MLLITNDRFWEPTMFMKVNELSKISQDVYENKQVIHQTHWGR
jgi:hypothetical protein